MVLDTKKIISKTGCFLFLLFFVMIFNGCSKQTKDKWLRVLLDGVPVTKKEEKPVLKGWQDREEDKKEAEPVAAEPEKPYLFFHLPYIEGQCNVCHDLKSSQRLIFKGKELCFTCHKDFTKDNRIIHFPIKEGDCIDCHDPHQSDNKYILKKPVNEVCFICHNEKDIKANPVHKRRGLCTDCHNPHASNEEKLFNF